MIKSGKKIPDYMDDDTVYYNVIPRNLLILNH